MTIIGIDPGYAIVGVGVVQYDKFKFAPINYGAITTSAGEPLPQRIGKIYDDLSKIIAAYKPDALAVEKLFFNTNTTTAIDVAQARGVILLAAQQHKVPIFEYTPLQIKQSVVGYGRAEKKQMQEMVKTILHLQEIPKPDDVADALAVAICHGHYSGSAMMR